MENGNGSPGSHDTAIIACGGASNTGKISEEIGERLHKECRAKFFSLAGLGGPIPGFADTILETDNVLVLDGCPSCCGKRCVDEEGLTGYAHLVLTELGIEKKDVLKWDDNEMESALDVARSMLGYGRDA